ncbi:hypothetical protein JCM8097_000302 [Rhodosporidiobolus ruineniae]
MSVNTTVGPVLVGAFLSSWTCGIVISLAATYAGRFRKDRRWIQCSVALATVWAMVDTALNLSWAYRWCVDYYAQPAQLAILPPELTAYCFVMSIAVFLIQCFYLYRLYTVSKNWLLCSVLFALALGAQGIALYMGAYCAKSTDITAFADIRSVSWGWFAGVLFIDACITAAMSWYLFFKPRKLLGHAVTSSPLRQVIVKAVQTNALSLIDQACIVALYATYPTSFYYVYFGFIEVKIYIGSFLATLNARNPHGDGGFDTTVSQETRAKGFGARSGLGQQPVHVTVQHEIAIDDLDVDVDGADSLDKAYGAGSIGHGHAHGANGQGPQFGTGAPYRVQFDRPARTASEMEKGRTDSF